jgi:hypothetical protein
VFQDRIGHGIANLRPLNLSGRRLIGGIGVSGVTSQQDAQIGQAGTTPRSDRSLVTPHAWHRAPGVAGALDARAWRPGHGSKNAPIS